MHLRIDTKKKHSVTESWHIVLVPSRHHHQPYAMLALPLAFSTFIVIIIASLGPACFMSRMSTFSRLFQDRRTYSAGLRPSRMSPNFPLTIVSSVSQSSFRLTSFGSLRPVSLPDFCACVCVAGGKAGLESLDTLLLPSPPCLHAFKPLWETLNINQLLRLNENDGTLLHLFFFLLSSLSHTSCSSLAGRSA